jgi:hypothetical protein
MSTRAENTPTPRPAESAIDRLANAFIDREVAKDADQGQAFREAQAKTDLGAIHVAA